MKNVEEITIIEILEIIINMYNQSFVIIVFLGLVVFVFMACNLYQDEGMEKERLFNFKFVLKNMAKESVASIIIFIVFFPFSQCHIFD